MKSPWEGRVGALLDSPKFVYKFKPYDSAAYGGQPRLDWLACDHTGLFWAIEVKTLPDGRKTVRLDTLVSAGQAQALNAVAYSAVGYALLAISVGQTLYFYDWRKIRWLLGATAPPALDLIRDSEFHWTWSGSKTWATYDLHAMAVNLPTMATATPTMTPSWGPSGPPPLPPFLGPGPGPASLPPGMGPMPLSYPPGLPPTPPTPSPSTSKRKASIRMRRRMLLSEQSSRT